MPIAVTTRAYDNHRSGANLQETSLTPNGLTTRGLIRLFSLELPGDARGAEAQPLIVPDVKLPDGQVRDVVYAATMANEVIAFDAADGTLLWERTLGTPVKSTPAIDLHPINDHWGILSTPVIDVQAEVMYLVSWISRDGSVGAAQHFVHAINITDGKDVERRVSLENVTYAPGHGLPVQTFRSAARKQRASLLLVTVQGSQTVFIGFGSLLESGPNARGWVIACKTRPLSYAAAWTATSKGNGGGIWHGGAGLVSDAEGFVYAMTGNGAFDGVTDFSESFVKLEYRPAHRGENASLSVADWWTPYTDAVEDEAASASARTDRRAGARPTAAADDHPAPPPTNARAADPFGYDWSDQDLGSGGPVLVPSAKALIGAGKDGILYVLDPQKMGKTSLADLQDPTANYGKLKSAPIFFTYFPGPTPSPAPANIQDLNILFAERTHHQHSSPLHWDSPNFGPMLFCWGENGNLRAWALQPNGAARYLACGAEVASAQANVPLGGMPGAMMCLSVNGNQPETAIVWCTIPYFDANSRVGPGRLLAYGATNFGTFGDGSKQLRVVWDSQAEDLPFAYNKFNPPVVANGRVFVPTYDGKIDVYGLK